MPASDFAIKKPRYQIGIAQHPQPDDSFFYEKDAAARAIRLHSESMDEHEVWAVWELPTFEVLYLAFEGVLFKQA